MHTLPFDLPRPQDCRPACTMIIPASVNKNDPPDKKALGK